jgi:hypothetical protein
MYLCHLQLYVLRQQSSLNYRPSVALYVMTTINRLKYRPLQLSVLRLQCSLNYRPFAALCVATTLYILSFWLSVALCCDYTVQFELPAIWSSLCCDYTLQFELPAICSSVLLRLHCRVWTMFYLEVVPTRNKQPYFISPQTPGHKERRYLLFNVFVLNVSVYDASWALSSVISQRIMCNAYGYFIKYLTATCRFISPRNTCNM